MTAAEDVSLHSRKDVFRNPRGAPGEEMRGSVQDGNKKEIKNCHLKSAAAVFASAV